VLNKKQIRDEHMTHADETTQSNLTTIQENQLSLAVEGSQHCIDLESNCGSQLAPGSVASIQKLTNLHLEFRLEKI